MRPYLAVIKDSFRAAMASWVLYVCLGVITLILLALLPMGLREEVATGLLEEEVVTPKLLLDQLTDAAEKEEESPAKVIHERFNPKLKTQIEETTTLLEGLLENEDITVEEIQSAQGKYRELFQEVVGAIDSQLSELDFYDKDAWNDVKLNDEAQDLLDEGVDNLTAERLKRFNRLAFDAAFPGAVETSARTRLNLTYFTWSMPSGVFDRVRKKDFVATIYAWLPGVLDKFVLSFGLIIAVLVTAPIIPQMLEPGSLHLLLSKPITRSALLVSKFVGGCAFVLLLATYMFIGLWLILGIRFGIWHPGLLWAIPLYTFAFAIYFAVSMAAGLLWRNSIVAVILTVLFWMVCFGVGWSKVGVHKWLEQFRPQSITHAGDEVPYLNNAKHPQRWNKEAQDWETTLMSPRQQEAPDVSNRAFEFVGPVYDPDRKMLFALRSPSFAMGLATLIISPESSDFPYVEAAFGPPLPSHLMLEPDGGLIAISLQGHIFRHQGDPLALIKYEQGQGGFTVEELRSEEVKEKLQFPWKPAGPEPALNFASPQDYAMNQQTGEIAAYGRGFITVLKKGEDGVYTEAVERKELPGEEGDSAEAASIAFAGKTIVLTRQSGDIFIIDPKTLKPKKTLPKHDSKPIQVVASPDAKWFAVLYENRELWLLNNTTGDYSYASFVSGQKDITAASFSPRNRLFVGNRTSRIIEYIPSTGEVDNQFDGGYAGSELVYHYMIMPAYLLLPKPGEFHYTISYLLAEDEGADQHPWRPLISGALFIMVMLGFACWRFERTGY